MWNALFWFVACARDIWCVVKMTCRNLAGHIAFDRPIVLNPASWLTPIVLVHGSSGNQSEWIDALPHIRSSFPNHPVYAFSLDLPYDKETGEQEGGNRIKGCLPALAMKRLARDHDWTIEQYAAELGKRIDAMPTPVILMGHSMGGLICAEYEKTHPEKVRYVVAFASPFQGAPLLNNWFMKLFMNIKRHKQMTPRSDFLQSLRPQTPDKYLTVGSEHDLQVPSAWAMIQNGTHILVSGYGHFTIVQSASVWRDVRAHVHKYLTSFVGDRFAFPTTS